MKRFLHGIAFITFLFLLPRNTIAQTNQTVNSGTATAAANFPGTGCLYTWVNDTPGIGLAASGTGNIPSFTAINTTGSPVLATITATPVANTFAYIANYYDNNVSVISTVTNTVVATIPVSSRPVGTAVSPDGSRVYVTTINGTVSVIDISTNTVVATAQVGSTPSGVAVSPDGSRVYVANQFSNTVSVINTANNATLYTIPVGIQPIGIAVSPDGSRVYTANYNSTDVSVINTATKTVVATISTGVSSGPECVAVSPDGSQVYVTNGGAANKVSVINTTTNTVIATIPTGGNSGPEGIAISPDGSRLYVANQTSNTVSVINTLTNTVVTNIPAGTTPFGISVTPDGSRVMVTNLLLGSSAVLVINTGTNTVASTVRVGSYPESLGNFISGGLGCSGSPVTFTITVNASPTITAGLASGTISACAGTNSASPNIQQFTASGSNLTGNITATAPTGFEVSLASGSGYSNSVTLTQSGGSVSNTIVYVRSAASASVGNISGNAVLTSTGATTQNVAVTGTVNVFPTVNAIVNQTDNNGAATTAVNFTGTANTFTWVNDTPGIGLPASGTGNIASFTAVNAGSTAIMATITVIPASGGCTGTPITFSITVNQAAPSVITAGAVTGTISACVGTASASPNIQQFTVSGSNLTGDIIATAPTGFEVSLTSGSGYGNSTTLTQSGGAVNNTIVYVRSAASASVGNISGNVMLASTGTTTQNVAITGTVNALPTVNAIVDQIVNNSAATTAVNFTGTANTFTWVNDTPVIGLAASGTGNIASFTAVNAGSTAITATITVTSASGGCTGTPITFTITVNPTSASPTITASTATGTINACAGTPSSSPNIQQITVSGGSLTNNITATAPIGFEVSLVVGSGYGNSVTIIQSGGTVNNIVVYVRSTASATAGNITGSVALTSAGATSQNVAVAAVVNALAIVNQAGNQTLANGTTSTAVNFTGTGVVYQWASSDPTIGLGASGTGNIPSFTATNNTTNILIATITVTPMNSLGCPGPVMVFTIRVNPAAVPIISAVGPLSALNTTYGTASATTQFNVSGANMPSGITVNSPPGFEISTNKLTFSNAVTIGTGGTITSTLVYIRLKSSTPAGNYAGNISLTGNGTTNASIAMPNSTVTPVSLTITADNKNKIFGTVNPALTITYFGFVNNDGPVQLATPASITTTAVTASPVGQYPITASGAVSSNYVFTYVPGILTVNPVIQTFVVPNMFTPNGDGINDTWDIKNLNTYTNCTVEIFNRYGTGVYFSNGYPVAWDGKYKGVELPVGTYYYIINTGSGSKAISGYVTIIR